MATSRSTKKTRGWIAGARIFSGRPDPTWAIDETIPKRLEEIWQSLEPWPWESPQGPALGYRGCFLTDGQERMWFAYGEVVTLRVLATSESRWDKGRVFEKLLLASAPKGMIPTSFADST